MLAATNSVTEAALALPADARLRLVDQLICSLNLPTAPDVEQLWAEEAERRIDQVERGELDLVAGELVFARLRAKYAR